MGVEPVGAAVGDFGVICVILASFEDWGVEETQPAMHSALVLRPSAHFRCCLERPANQQQRPEARCGDSSPGETADKSAGSLLLRFVSTRYAVH